MYTLDYYFSPSQTALVPSAMCTAVGAGVYEDGCPRPHALTGAGQQISQQCHFPSLIVELVLLSLTISPTLLLLPSNVQYWRIDRPLPDDVRGRRLLEMNRRQLHKWEQLRQSSVCNLLLSCGI